MSALKGFIIASSIRTTTCSAACQPYHAIFTALKLSCLVKDIETVLVNSSGVECCAAIQTMNSVLHWH